MVNPAQVFAAFGCVALASLLVGEIAKRPHDTREGGMLLLQLLMLHVHVAWHELGHLWATYVCRYHPRRVVVCSLAAASVGGRWRLQPTREWRFFLSGAVVFSADYNRRTWSRDLLCYSAGPVATLVSIVAILMAQPFTQGVPALENFRQKNLELSLFLLVFNVLPLRQFRTDGYELLELLKLRS